MYDAYNPIERSFGNFRSSLLFVRRCSWRSKGSGSGADSHEGAQIDLLIDRKDETVNICEIKYYKEQFEISRDYEERLQNKLNRFARETKTNKSLLLTMITANGIKHNSHSDIVQKEIVLEDLFK